MSTKESIYTKVMQARLLEPYRGNSFIIRETVLGELHESVITFDELNALHPRLAASLEAHLQAKVPKPGKAFGVLHDDIIATYKLLTYGGFRFTNLMSYPRFLAAIHQIELKPQREHVNISGEEPKLGYVDVNGANVPYLLDRVWCSDMLSYEELEKMRPGALDRYAIARSMELDSTALLDYVLYSTAKQSKDVDVSELVFDGDNMGTAP